MKTSHTPPALELTFNPRVPIVRKTKDDIIDLYITICQRKSIYRYDLKKLIMDLFPFKKNLYIVYIADPADIRKSKTLNNTLSISEHRFITFLMRTILTEDEIQKILDTHARLVRMAEPPREYQY